MKTLFDDPPSQPHSATSVAAAAAVKPDANRLRALVLDALRAVYPDGLTDEQIIDTTGLSPSTARPRRIELVQRNLVRDSGRKRKTRSGREAVIWEATA